MAAKKKRGRTPVTFRIMMEAEGHTPASIETATDGRVSSRSVARALAGTRLSLALTEELANLFDRSIDDVVAAIDATHA